MVLISVNKGLSRGLLETSSLHILRIVCYGLRDIVRTCTDIYIVVVACISLRGTRVKEDIHTVYKVTLGIIRRHDYDIFSQKY
jgi:hypothetical protein